MTGEGSGILRVKLHDVPGKQLRGLLSCHESDEGREKTKRFGKLALTIQNMNFQISDQPKNTNRILTSRTVKNL